jgi:competence protein ComEC
MRLVPAAAAVWLATLLGITCGWVWTVVCGVGLAIVATVRVVWGRRGAVRVAALGVLVCGLVTAGWTGYRLHHEAADPLVGLARRGDSVRLRVELTDLPKPIMSAGFAGRPGGVRSVLIPADAIAVAVHGRTEPVDGQVLLIAPVKGWGGLLRGQQVDASGQLSPPLPSDNATAAVLRVRGAPRNLSPPSLIQRTAESLRRGLRTAAAGLPDDDRGLLPAIVIADRSGVRQPVLDDFRRSGMAYLMAVGGCTSWWSAVRCCGCSAESASVRVCRPPSPGWSWSVSQRSPAGSPTCCVPG